MLPFASATRHHRRRTLFDEVDEVAVDATWPGAGAGAGVDANLTASIVVDAAAAAIDLAEVYTRQEQQRLQGMHPAASSRRRNLLHRTIGYTMGKAGCGKELTVRVEHENDGAGPTPRRTVKPGEEALAACLQQPERCGAGSREAGRSLPGVSALRKAPKVQLTGLLPKGKTFKSCAIVGNAGHLNNHEYGKYIDNHEAVVRFNILPVAGFEKHIGEVSSLSRSSGGVGVVSSLSSFSSSSSSSINSSSRETGSECDAGTQDYGLNSSIDRFINIDTVPLTCSNETCNR